MKIVDKHGVWMTNFGQFRMHDPSSDTYFEPGESVKATDTAWRQLNKAVVKLTDEEGALVDDPDLVAEVAETAAEADPKADPKPKK